jgi:hypothetical protein
LRDFVFIDCEVRGPVVLVPQGCTFAHTDFGGPVEAILWEVPPERAEVTGAILARNCTFEKCRFVRIGLAGPPAFAAQLRGVAAIEE